MEENGQARPWGALAFLWATLLPGHLEEAVVDPRLTPPALWSKLQWPGPGATPCRWPEPWGCRAKGEDGTPDHMGGGSWQGCGSGVGALPGTGPHSKRAREETSLPTAFHWPNPRRCSCHALLDCRSHLQTQTWEEPGTGSPAGPQARVHILKLSALMDTFILNPKSSNEIVPLSHGEVKTCELTEKAWMRCEALPRAHQRPHPHPALVASLGLRVTWTRGRFLSLMSPLPQPRAHSQFV